LWRAWRDPSLWIVNRGLAPCYLVSRPISFGCLSYHFCGYSTYHFRWLFRQLSSVLMIHSSSSGSFRATPCLFLCLLDAVLGIVWVNYQNSRVISAWAALGQPGKAKLCNIRRSFSFLVLCTSGAGLVHARLQRFEKGISEHPIFPAFVRNRLL
jgi:hypothetical protein